MPKAKARHRGKRVGSAPEARKPQEMEVRAAPTENSQSTGSTGGRRRGTPSNEQSMMGLLTPAMVTLGCIGMAISFMVFTTDPNRNVYGSLAIVLALMWAVMFGIRLRKVLQRK